MSSSAVEHACADLLDTASTSPSSSHSGAARKESCPVVHADDAAEVEGVLISSNSQSDNAYVTKKDDTNNDKKRTMTYAAASQCAMNSKPLKETGIHPVDGGGGNPTVAENIAPSPLPAPPLQQPSPSGGGYGSLEMQLAIAEGRIVKLSHENKELKNMLIFKDHELDSITAAYQLVSTENATLHATIEHNEMRHLQERTELYASLQQQEQQLSLLQQQCAQFQHKLSSTIASHSRSMSTDIIPQSSSASEDRVLTGDRSPSGLASEATFHKRIALLESEQRNTHKELHTAQETILELETELEGLRAERYAATRKPTSDVGVMADDSYLGTTVQDQMLISALQVLSSSSARPIQVKLHVDPDPMTHTLRQLIDVCETSELSDLINLPPWPWRPPGEEFTFQRDRQPMNWSDDLPSPLVRLMERKAAANEEEAGSVRVSGSTRLTAQQPPHHHPGSRSFSWGGEGLISSDATEFFGIRKQPPFLHAAPKNRAEVIALKK